MQKESYNVNKASLKVGGYFAHAFYYGVNFSGYWLLIVPMFKQLYEGQDSI